MTPSEREALIAALPTLKRRTVRLTVCALLALAGVMALLMQP